MDAKSSGYSPNILIYLDVGGKTIRLADVLNDSATLYESAEVPANTPATLVISVDGEEERKKVLLSSGISKSSMMISFAYTDPH